MYEVTRPDQGQEVVAAVHRLDGLKQRRASITAELDAGVVDRWRVHSATRMTPTLALGVTNTIWSVEDLVRVAPGEPETRAA